MNNLSFAFSILALILFHPADAQTCDSIRCLLSLDHSFFYNSDGDVWDGGSDTVFFKLESDYNRLTHYKVSEIPNLLIKVCDDTTFLVSFDFKGSNFKGKVRHVESPNYITRPSFDLHTSNVYYYIFCFLDLYPIGIWENLKKDGTLRTEDLNQVFFIRN